MRRRASAGKWIAAILLLVSLVPRSSLGEAKYLGGNGNDYVYGLCPLSDGLLLLGETFSEANTGDVADSAGAMPRERSTAWAVCLNRAGEMVWQTCYAGKKSANARFLAGIERDGRFVLYATGGQAGDDALVILDEQGKNAQVVPTPRNVDVYEVCPSERGLILAGTTWDEENLRPWCALLDASGETVWSYAGEPILREEGRCYFEHAASGDDRIVLYEARLPYQNAEGSAAFLTAIDLDGNLLSRIRLDTPAPSYVSGIIAQGSDVLLIGSSYDGGADLQIGTVVKLDEQGKRRWIWTASEQSGNTEISDLLLLEDGYFLCGTQYDYASPAYTQALTGFLSFDGESPGLRPLPEGKDLTDLRAFTISQDEIVLTGNAVKKITAQSPCDEVDAFILKIRGRDAR